MTDFKPTYRPFRIMRLFEIQGASRESLQASFPHAKEYKKRGKIWYAVFDPNNDKRFPRYKNVVNVPTREEIQLFTAMGIAAEIPLDGRKRDKLDSGLARPTETAIRARDNAPKEIAKLEETEVNRKRVDAGLPPIPEEIKSPLRKRTFTKRMTEKKSGVSESEIEHE